MKISEMQQAAWQNSENHGFHQGADNMNIPTKLMLITCEVSEAMEEYRKKDTSEKYIRYNYNIDPNGKPEGLATELADIVIRVGDLCGILNIDLEETVKEKMSYNETRPYMHGKRL